MATTKSGEKATRLRGYKHFWLLQPRHGRRINVIELKPGARIEDVDTRIVQRAEDVTWGEHIAASKFKSEYSADPRPVWYVTLPGCNSVGPYTTKTDTLREIRTALPNLHRYF
jgi:hypothetical protein